MRILVATDLTPASDEAVRQADRIARERGAELIVCHVPATPRRPWSARARAARAPAEIAAVEDVVANLTGRRGNDLVVEIGHGDPAEAILETSAALAVAGIVVGATSRFLRSTLAGVAERIARRASCPVHIARPSSANGCVLAATDLSDPAYPAIQEAMLVATVRRAPLALVHVVDIAAHRQADTAFEHTRASRRAELEALSRSFAGQRLVFVKHGIPERCILAAAEDLPTQLLVVGMHPTSRFARLLRGSVAEAVLRDARCPVRVVRLDATRAALAR